MDDETNERLDNLDLAVTQLADALEVVVTLLQGSVAMRYDLQRILQQLATARTLIGTEDGTDDGTDDGAEPVEPA